MQSLKKSTLAATVALASLTGAGLVSGKPGRSAPKPPAKPFSYDPLCRWGRLSDGKGFVVRCLTESESRALREGKHPTGSSTPEAAEEKPQPTASFEVVLGPIRADTGTFPKGVKSLNKGMVKYRACVERHGGITAARATVDVRFLVRGRGRAEGAVAKKHQGMSAEAAKCIADVVDRRFVGYPDAEMVGATLVVTVEKR
jgi:hypothetical protein